MRAVFSEIQASSGSDGDGITFAMLEEKMNEPTVRQYLETLGFLTVYNFFKLHKLQDFFQVFGFQVSLKNHP